MKKRLLALIICTTMALALLPLSSAVYTERPGETLIYNITFENESDMDLFHANGEGCTIMWANRPGAGHEDDQAMRVEHIAGMPYTSSDNAVRLTLPEPLPPGAEYRIWAMVYIPSAENPDKGILTGPGIVLNDDYPGAQGVVKFPVEFGTIMMDTWHPMNARMPIHNFEISTIDFRFVINDADKHPDVWYWDNIEIWQVGEAEEVRIPTWDMELPSLREAFKDYFQFGNTLEPHHTADAKTTEMFLHHYDTVTSGNAMKPMYITVEPGMLNFGGPDTIVDWATANNVSVHGHTLVWHSQSAPWLTNAADGSALTRAQAKANMEWFITEYAGRYAGRVASWDVVNEAFADSVSPGLSWRDGLRMNSPWYRAYANGMNEAAGEEPADYIYDAFVFTRLAAPDAILFYNDFNEEYPGKREAMARMTEEFNERWTSDPRNTEPSRLLIEGLGMQAHYWVDVLNPADVRATIERFIETGARIRVTELDIPFGRWDTYTSRTSEPTASELEHQAGLYSALFRIFIEYSDHIDAVTIWGHHDSQSWRAAGYPLLFDEWYEEKPAFWNILEVVDPGARDRHFGLEEEPEPDLEPEAPPPPPTPEPPPPTPEPPLPEESNIPWPIIGVGIGVLIAGGIGAIIIVVMTRKKD